MSDEPRLFTIDYAPTDRGKQLPNWLRDMPAEGLPGRVTNMAKRSRERTRFALRARFVDELQLSFDFTPCGFRGCRRPGVERHHYAPKEMFGALAEHFPILPLCEHHHHLWHDTVNVFRRANEEEAS